MFYNKQAPKTERERLNDNGGISGEPMTDKVVIQGRLHGQELDRGLCNNVVKIFG